MNGNTSSADVVSRWADRFSLSASEYFSLLFNWIPYRTKKVHLLLEKNKKQFMLNIFELLGQTITFAGLSKIFTELPPFRILLASMQRSYVRRVQLMEMRPSPQWSDLFKNLASWEIGSASHDQLQCFSSLSFVFFKIIVFLVVSTALSFYFSWHLYIEILI